MTDAQNAGDADRITCPRCAGKGFLTPATSTIGDMIALHRRKLGMTQMELCVHVGVSRAQIANIESGRSDPSIKMLRSYADALRCQMKDLVP